MPKLCLLQKIAYPILRIDLLYIVTATVCSCFAMGIYKAGGLFEGLDIRITEFIIIQIKVLIKIYSKRCNLTKILGF